MKTPRFFSLAVALLLLGLVFTGCTDSPFEASEAPIAQEPITKMRQSHLFASKFLSRGKVLERYEELAAANDFVLGFSSTVLDAQRVLERYDAEAGVTVKRLFTKSMYGMAMFVDNANVERILYIVEADDDIAWIEPDTRVRLPANGKVKAFPPTQQIISSVAQINGKKSSTRPGDGRGSVGVNLYILDSGIDHPDLNIVERVDWTATGQEIDATKVLERYDSGLAAAGDGYGHGTHVAGIAAAIDDSYALVGMAPGARLHDFRILNDQGNGEMSSVIAAMDVITARKLANPRTPVVVNLSLGAEVGTTEYNAMDYAIENAIAHGVVVVVAAGNNTTDVATVTPARVQGAITVAACGRDGKSLAFSNFGPGVDIWAPGEDIESLSPDYSVMVEMSGTSMSAPLAAGVAALYLSRNSRATPQEVLDALRANAQRNKVVPPANTTDLLLDAAAF